MFGSEAGRNDHSGQLLQRRLWRLLRLLLLRLLLLRLLLLCLLLCLLLHYHCA